MNFHTLAANFHTTLTVSDSETSIHQPVHCGPAQEPCQYIHAKHVASGQLRSGIPAAHTILRLRCHFCPLCFLSCSERRLWDEGHFSWQQGRSAPLRLSSSTAFNSAPLWLTSLLGVRAPVRRTVCLRACVCVCERGRLLKSWSFNTAQLSTLCWASVHVHGRWHCHSPALLTSLCLDFFFFLCPQCKRPTLADLKSSDREGSDLWI